MDALLQELSAFCPYGIIALLVTALATPVAAAVARRVGVMDVPDTHLKPHARPTPYLGGTAICAGWAAALLAAATFSDAAWGLVLPILLGGIAMSLIGLVDDVREISPKLRLALGVVLIGAVLLSTGTGFRLVEAVLAALGVHGPGLAEGPQRTILISLSVLIGIFIVLGAVNAANLIDGLNGLCAGVTAVMALGYLILAAYLGGERFSATGDPVRLAVAAALLGATLGFLPMNFPGRIFMGDAGSVLLGYTCGILILLFAENGLFHWIVGALVIFTLPVFDTALAVFRRWRSGRPLFEGDRSHFYDQLVQRGLSVPRTVLISYAVTAVYVAIGLLVIWLRARWAIAVFLSVVVLTVIVAVAVGLTRPASSGPAGNRGSANAGD